MKHHHNRRRLRGSLLVWPAILIACVSVLHRTAVCAAERPNVILVMCDDLGWGDLRCYNAASRIHTPHLTAMAGNSLKFDRFYAAAPVCSPTRGSCITGRHPSRYGIPFANTGHMKSSELTLAELLQQAGYRTGHFGKWHLGTCTTEIRDSNRGGPDNKQHFSPPWRHGYDTCFVTEAKVPTYDPLLKPRKAGRTAWDAIKDPSQAEAYGTRYWNERGEVVSENTRGDDSRVIMDRAVEFIGDAVANDSPFLAVIWFHAPHLPVVAGPQHVARYKNENVYARNYYGCVTALDEQVGRLRAVLRERGVADHTMLWFCSDNGPEGQSGKSPGLAGGLRGRKRSLYEGGIRVPGLLEWPDKIQAERSTTFPAVTSDYLPTVLEALQIPYPDDRPLDGISLMPLINGELSEREEGIGFESRGQAAWVTQRYKLYRANNDKDWELYDLLEDAAESTNLAERHQDQVRRLSAAYRTWAASCQRSAQSGD